MPLGSRVDETGVVIDHRGSPILRRDDGGTWRLDADRNIRASFGRRVHIIGIRSDFDLIDVVTVTPC